MARLSIFAKRPFYSRKRKCLFRGSSLIRGEQVADYTGARLNPISNYENDICIYIKPRPEWLCGENVKLPKRIYIDIVDGSGLIGFVRSNPKMSIIACGRTNYEYLAHNLNNKVVFIPQHHCNFEGVVRERKRVTMVGVIGVPGAFDCLPEGLEEKLVERGFKLLKYSSFRTREDVVDFYRKIDIQVVWRERPKTLANPLKIVNAAAFGIPTIAYEEGTFGEVKGCYIPVKALGELIEQALILRKSPRLYGEYRDRCLDKAQKYHIKKIAKMYKQLS